MQSPLIWFLFKAPNICATTSTLPYFLISNWFTVDTRLCFFSCCHIGSLSTPLTFPFLISPMLLNHNVSFSVYGNFGNEQWRTRRRGSTVKEVGGMMHEHAGNRGMPKQVNWIGLICHHNRHRHVDTFLSCYVLTSQHCESNQLRESNQFLKVPCKEALHYLSYDARSHIDMRYTRSLYGICQ